MSENKLTIAQKWADIVIERWQKKIISMKIIDTGDLLKSFLTHISADANGDPTKIAFAFLYYGRFSDMGVGKGVKISDVPDVNRQQKKWYSDTFLREVQVLGRIMAEKYGIEAAEEISAFSSSMYDNI